MRKPRTLEVQVPPKRRASIEDVAYHESGHCVVHVRLGTPVLWVDVEHRPSENQPAEPPHPGAVFYREGHCMTEGLTTWLDALPADWAQDKVARYACGVAGGIAAEILRGTPPEEVRRRTSSDQVKLFQLGAALGVPYEERSVFWNEMVKRARAQLLDGRAAWETIAQELIRKRRLTQLEISAILR